MKPDEVNAVLSNWKTARVSPRIQGALHLLEILTKRPWEISPRLLEELGQSGLTKEDMEQLAAIGVHFNFINRVADAYRFPVPGPKEMNKLARLLDFAGRHAPFGKWPEPSYDAGEDGVLRPVELNRWRSNAFTAPGVLPEQFRRAVESYTAKKWQAQREERPIESAALKAYLDLLALEATRITDQHIADLENEGFDAPQFYEITCCGAMGAALPAVENLFKFLYR